MIRGLLIDIDGVLITNDRPLPGAVDTIRFLNEQRIPFLLVTNTTRKNRMIIWHQLKRLGFEITEEAIFTAPLAAVQFLKSKQVSRIHLLLSGSAIHDFKDFKSTAGNPEYVVIGDLGKDLTFDKLNRAFRLVMKGARMLALQKNRYWESQGGLTIDAGAIVAALEYSTGKRALVIGKPRKEFFLQAVSLLGIPSENVAMIGDDIEVDVGGAQKAGLQGFLVKTGKFRQNILNRSRIKPDRILNSIADLPEFLNEQNISI